MPKDLSTPETTLPRDIVVLAAYMRQGLIDAIPASETGEILDRSEQLAAALVLGSAAIEIVGDGDVAPHLKGGDWLALARNAVEALFADEELQETVLKQLDELKPHDDEHHEGIDIETYRKLQKDAEEDGSIRLDKLSPSDTFLLEYVEYTPNDDDNEVVREMLVRPFKASREVTWLSVMRDQGFKSFGRPTQERFMGKIISVGTIINNNGRLQHELRVGGMLVVTTPGDDLDNNYGRLYQNNKQFLNQVYYGNDRRFPIFPKLDLS